MEARGAVRHQLEQRQAGAAQAPARAGCEVPVMLDLGHLRDLMPYGHSRPSIGNGTLGRRNGSPRTGCPFLVTGEA